MSPADIEHTRDLAQEYIDNKGIYALDIYRKVRHQHNDRYGYGFGPVGPWERVRYSSWFLLEVWPTSRARVQGSTGYHDIIRCRYGGDGPPSTQARSREGLRRRNIERDDEHRTA